MKSKINIKRPHWIKWHW